MEELKCDFIEEDLIEHMNSEELEMVLAYISKWFDTIEDSKVQLNNCMNLIKFINNHDFIIEEIEAEKERYREEILSKGFLPINDELDETMSSSMEDVEKNPRRFIIEECIPACEELWNKNIYTFMVSDHLNEGQCWEAFEQASCMELDNLVDNIKLVKNNI